MFDQIVLPVILSIAATFIATPLLFIFSPRSRSFIITVASKIIGVDIINFFPDRASALSDMAKELSRADFVYFLTGRGQELQVEPFYSLLAGRSADKKHSVFNILLPITKDVGGHANWTKINEENLSRMDPAYGQGLLLKQIETSYETLNSYSCEMPIEIRRYNNPHIGRVILTDSCAYFNYYNYKSNAIHNPVIKFSANGLFYNVFLYYFKLLWDNAPNQ